MIDSIHYLKENNNRINVNTVLVYMYILKPTRLTPKMTTANYRSPEGGRLYDMKVVSGYAFLRTYFV